MQIWGLGFYNNMEAVLLQEKMTADRQKIFNYQKRSIHDYPNSTTGDDESTNVIMFGIVAFHKLGAILLQISLA